MFDIGAIELLVIVIVAILVIGPSEMPRAMRSAGRWIGQIRKISAHFRTGVDAMVREAELEDMEKKWKAQNEAVMKRTAGTVENEAGEPVMTGPPPVDAPADSPVSGDSAPDPDADDPAPAAPPASSSASSPPSASSRPEAAPELPLGNHKPSKE